MRRPSTTPDDLEVDVRRSRRLQRRLRIQVMCGYLGTALLVGTLSTLQFYDYRQQSTLEKMQQDLRFGALALGAKFGEYLGIAQQVTSRSYIRVLLERYNRGELALDELRAESAPRLADALRQATAIVGIRRFDSAGRLVVEVGEPQGEPAAPALDGDLPRLGTPRLTAQGARLAVGAPILTAEALRVGTDLVEFDIADTFAIVERLKQQFDFSAQIFLAADGGMPFQLEPAATGTLRDELPVNWFERAIGETGAGGAAVQTLAGHTFIVAPIPQTGWRMVLAAGSDDILGEPRADSAFLFAAIMVLALGGMLITNLLVKPTVGRILIGERKLESLYRQNQQWYEQTLKNSRLLDGVVNGISTIIFVKDLNGRYILANQAFADERGMTREEVIGKTDFDFHSPETARALRNNDLLAIEKGELLTVEEQVEVEGEIRWFVTTKVPLRDQDDRVYATCGLATDVTEIKKNEELRHALEKAEAADYAKTAFLANMSHELRTPLHGILSYAELGSRRIDRVDRDKLCQYYDNIHTSGIRLLELLNDLLDLSKLEAGKYEMVYQEIRPGELLDECLVELAPMIEARQIEIGRPHQASDYVFEGDQGKFLQVLRNLLGNAVKFSPPRGRIDVEFGSCHLRAGDLHLEGFECRLIDDGEGIAAGEIDQVFDKFYQSGKSRSGGTGLGLSICREIVLLHQGEISADNCPGRGARFTVRLPRHNPSTRVSKMRVV